MCFLVPQQRNSLLFQGLFESFSIFFAVIKHWFFGILAKARKKLSKRVWKAGKRGLSLQPL